MRRLLRKLVNKASTFTAQWVLNDHNLKDLLTKCLRDPERYHAALNQAMDEVITYWGPKDPVCIMARSVESGCNKSLEEDEILSITMEVPSPAPRETPSRPSSSAPRYGWRIFHCNECGHTWEETSRDRHSPSMETCSQCDEDVAPHAARPHMDDFKVLENGNVEHKVITLTTNLPGLD